MGRSAYWEILCPMIAHVAILNFAKIHLGEEKKMSQLLARIVDLIALGFFSHVFRISDIFVFILFF